MDKLITAIQSTDPNSEKDLRALKSTLHKAEETFFKNLPHLDDALSVLDPKVHTLGWIFILYVVDSSRHMNISWDIFICYLV